VMLAVAAQAGIEPPPMAVEDGASRDVPAP
jgi:hypothetical protein